MISGDVPSLPPAVWPPVWLSQRGLSPVLLLALGLSQALLSQTVRTSPPNFEMQGPLRQPCPEE